MCYFSHLDANVPLSAIDVLVPNTQDTGSCGDSQATETSLSNGFNTGSFSAPDDICHPGIKASSSG